MANAAISDRDLRRVVIASLIGATIEWYDFSCTAVAGIVFNKLFSGAGPSDFRFCSLATFAIGLLPGARRRCFRPFWRSYWPQSISF